MSNPDHIRTAVSESYARAVSGGGGCCSSPRQPKGVTARIAGYGEHDTAALPDDAVENSFGCGNPLAFSQVQPGQVVLDLGSGAGIDLLIAAGKVGPAGRVIGVDMTDAMIERARANVAAAGAANVEVRKGLIEELPVEDESVDWVISNCVINLSPEKHRVFAEIARVLKPGGRMLVSDIVVEDLPAWAREASAVISACIGGAVPEAEYLDGLKAAGLADIEVVDRFAYDRSALMGLLGEEVDRLGGCCGSPGPITEDMVACFEGKVTSIRVAARKG